MPQRLDYLADHIEADLTSARAGAQALRQFYSLLSPEQRQLFDEVTRPPVGGPGAAVDASPQPAPSAPNYGLPSHTNPTWMIKPRGEDLARVYPTAAWKAKVTGKVLMSCIADEDGYLADCVVQDENPKGMGFGNAALEISAYMRMVPATNYGVPVRSAVNMPITFTPRK